MHITRDMTVAELATTRPATIRVFQKHHIDFCCGGKIPLGDAAERHAIDADLLLAELNAATSSREDDTAWERASLTALVEHIQERFHAPLREELPRLAAMVAKVVSRHGNRLPDTLLPLESTFEGLRQELLAHMHKEDAILFPAIVALEAGASARGAQWTWISQPIDVMEAEHDQAGAALAALRAITSDYTPPADACPTFRGLYHGLADLEATMHLHVHLENNVLFPRAEALARERSA